ncbi:phenylacetate-CoA oxygenase subunit PaaJ [Novosphingobium sp. ERN07]|nr:MULTISPECIES: 1,2-phenylacetyl-CoA epoxidase subunit PaaD [unclassified Novosphingobium]AXU20754.1 phenylacetate-CoA oxygenase subunit PaaJ [Novosphingobium sp. THN1]NLR41043.1 phenylacetate-CoA oxygenase subunit PaaJ [Novosphingobium sp. ERW19]NLR70794.1 phenylacetate-CoA oxygenase subunit PaaJ [Novosphingobium sp. ERN07]
MPSDLAGRIAAILADVPDPEIPAVSIIDLGIVREVGGDDGAAWVALTPTYSGCPATSAIGRAARDALDAAGLEGVSIRIVLSPAWSTAMITPQGHDKLRRYGIAPPSATGESGPCACPRCGSLSTHEISRFGSTPCKALWQCDACLEPFDRFKCH